MSDELLRFYNNELQFLRRQGKEFARAHPQVASHLNFGTEGDYDPYVGRMVEAFAYLNARTRQKLEDDFPEVAGSLLEIILPHYQRPIPSASVTQFILDRGQAELYSGYEVPRRSVIETAPIEGQPCRFQTCYPVTCWPFSVENISLRGVPFDAPKFSLPAPALGLLKVSLKTFSNDVPFSRFKCNRLRFFVRLATPFSYQTYEMLMSDILGISIAAGPADPKAIFLPSQAIKPVGFAEDEGLVEYPAQSFLGYRLLSEYFAFPEKFLFFDIELDRQFAGMDSSSLELYFYIKKRWQDLEPHIQSDSLQLGCTPIVNLFPLRAEPIRLTHFDASYTVIPDARRPLAHEVYAIEKVTGSSPQHGDMDFAPFYSFRHTTGRSVRGFWHAARRELESDNELARGTEVDISFVDLDFRPSEPGNWTIDVETLCTNRNLAARLPFGGGQPKMQLEGGGALDEVRCLIKPTVPLRPPLGQNLRWRVVSHLSLNHLSLSNSETGAAALREILTLYDFRGDEVTANSVAGVLALTSRMSLARLPEDRTGTMLRGLEMTIKFDEDKYTGGSLFLFASVLDRFLGLYCNLNAFTQTVAISNRQQGVVHRWPPRAGTQTLL